MRKVLILLTSLLVLAACDRDDSVHTGPVFGPGPRHVLVISLDCLRADHLGCYGYEREISPSLDALAGQGVRFAHATAPFNWTLPSHVSLFTGLYTRGHGVRLENQALSEEVPNLVERLRDAGFATAAFTGGAYMKKEWGHDRGFETYWSSPRETRQFEGILKRGEDWLADHRDRDAFLFLHTYEIHMPYTPPRTHLKRVLGYHATQCQGQVHEMHAFIDGAPEIIRKEAVGRYDAGILYADELLGAFLERLDAAGLAENLMLIVASDHGEAFWEHGRWGHNGDLLGPQLTDVPLIVRMPRAAFPEFAPKVLDTQVSFLDIMPTVLDAVDVEPTSDLDGFSLLPELVGRPVTPDGADARARRTVTIDGHETLIALTECRNFVSARAGGWTAVVEGPVFDGAECAPWPALYELSSDPGELEPRPLEGPIADALRAAAAALVGRPGDARQDAVEIPIDDKLRKRLEAVGYL